MCIGMMISFLLTGCGAVDLPLTDEGKMVFPDSEIIGSLDSETPPEVITTDEYDIEAAEKAAMDFAVKLFQYVQLHEMVPGENTSSNILISPISMYLALGMLENGAKGETLSQLEETLGLNYGQMNCFAEEYLENLPNEMKIANSIWYTDDERFTLEESFAEMNQAYFNADLYREPFDESTVKAVNDWIEKHTDGAIKEMLDEIPADAVMYLINALVYEAEWEQKYDEGQVRTGAFHVSKDLVQEAEMMYSEEGYYLEDEDATGFIKYYKDRKYAFAALLPKEGQDVFSYIRKLSGEKLQNLLANPQEILVNAAMPQFKNEYEVQMKDILQEMGVVDVFDSGKADLSGLGTSSAGNIFVDRVLHKTFIEVTAAGTKAGAATIIECKDECAIMTEKEVILDRPFVYMIIDCETNQPIFMGTVNYV